MKRLLLLLVLLSVFAATLFAAFPGMFSLDVAIPGLAVSTSGGREEILLTLPDEGESISIGRAGLGTMKRVFDEHDFLSFEYEERLAIYDRLSVPLAWPILKNITLGFGSGSRLQRYQVGALVGVVLDSASLIVIGAGFFGMIFEGWVIGLSGGPDIDEDAYMKMTSLKFLLGGVIALKASRIIQGIIPAVYGLRYNKVLRDGLGLNKDRSDALGPAIGFAPIPTPDGKILWQVAARVPLH